MPQDYIRCHYISEDKIECASWFPRGEGNLCIVHRNSVAGHLAANGINKPEYIGARKERESYFRDTYDAATQSPQEICTILDAHLANIEKEIEKLKTDHQVVRAIRGEVIEGMSAEEIQARRRMRVPKSESNGKPKSSGKIIGTNEEKIQKLMAKHPGMTEIGAKMLLGLD